MPGDPATISIVTSKRWTGTPLSGSGRDSLEKESKNRTKYSGSNALKRGYAMRMRFSVKARNLILFFIFLTAFISWRVISAAWPSRREDTQGRMCLSNQRQLVMALIIASHETGLIPQTLESVKKETTEVIMRCPSDKRNRKLGYGLNGCAAGKRADKFGSPQLTPLTMDAKTDSGIIRSQDDIDKRRHRKGFIVSYLDGSVCYFQSKQSVILEPAHSP